jgi:hypothetical protein
MNLQNSLPQNHRDFDSFRECLLNLTKKDLFEKRFLNYIPNYNEESEANGFIPFSILSWNFSSRRIFHLPSNVQNLLDATTINAVRWKEIRFPFDSFIITLTDLLVSYDGTAYDSIIVSNIGKFLPSADSSDLWELRLLPPSLSRCKRLKKTERKELLNLIRRQASEHEIECFFEKHLSYDKDGKMTLPIMYFKPNEMSENFVIKTFLNANILDISAPLKDFAINSAFHIFINLCIYLENFPASTTKKNEKMKSSSKKRVSLENAFIDQTSDLFTVSAKFKMKQEKIDQLVSFIKSSKASQEKRVHWRRAHWRRKPGCGNIPLDRAPKDWIPMKLINAHKLPENALPIATEAIA